MSTACRLGVAACDSAVCTINNQTPDLRSLPGAGANQHALAVKSLIVRLWGAGGGGGSYPRANGDSGGGGGGFTTGVLPVTPGEKLTIIVGQGGIFGRGTSNTCVHANDAMHAAERAHWPSCGSGASVEAAAVRGGATQARSRVARHTCLPCNGQVCGQPMCTLAVDAGVPRRGAGLG